MGVGQLSESDAVDALRLPFYSSSHPTGSHGWRIQFDLGNPDLLHYPHLAPGWRGVFTNKSNNALTPDDLEAIRREIAGAEEAPQAIEAAPAAPETAPQVQAESAASALAEPPDAAPAAPIETRPVVEPSDAAAPVEAIERPPTEPQRADGDDAPVATPLSEQSPPPVAFIELTTGTPLFWRVLEGFAAALALALLAALVWNLRATNRL